MKWIIEKNGKFVETYDDKEPDGVCDTTAVAAHVAGLKGDGYTIRNEPPEPAPEPVVDHSETMAAVEAEILRLTDPVAYAKQQALAQVKAEYDELVAHGNDDLTTRAAELLTLRTAAIEAQFAPGADPE